MGVFMPSTVYQSWCSYAPIVGGGGTPLPLIITKKNSKSGSAQHLVRVDQNKDFDSLLRWDMINPWVIEYFTGNSWGRGPKKPYEWKRPGEY